MQGQPDWLEDLSLADKVPAGSVAMISEYRLELNGKFASRETTEILGQAMTVTAVISSEGLRFLDDRGGSRTEAYRRFPLDACDRGSVGDELEHAVRTRPGGCADPALFFATFDEANDDHGTIVEVVRDGQGLPIGVRFGENLLLRYKFTPLFPAPAGSVGAGGRWREPSAWDLIALRASAIVIDSVDAARVASVRPVLALSAPRRPGRHSLPEDGLIPLPGP